MQQEEPQDGVQRQEGCHGLVGRELNKSEAFRIDGQVAMEEKSRGTLSAVHRSGHIHAGTEWPA